MAKKSKISLEQILLGVSAILGIVAICMMFVSNVTLGAESSLLSTSFSGGSYSGIDVTFGKENYFNFSFMNLLTYILLLVAVVLCVLKMFNVLKGKVGNYIIAILLVVAGIFFFCTGAFTNLVASSSIFGTIDITKSLAVGAILGGVFSIVSAIIAIVPAFVSSKK